jgi:hypothetical protein
MFPVAATLVLLLLLLGGGKGIAAGGRLNPLGGNTALNAAGGCVGWWGLTGALPGWLLPPLLPTATSRLFRRLLLLPAAASRLLRRLLL